MTSPARIAAYYALRAVAAGDADLPGALHASRRQLGDERDRSLTAEIVTGTLRWQRKLDFLIEHFAKRPLARLDTEVVLILRLSLYQLLHLDRVPAAAVVDDAVNLSRLARKPSASGFVNGVLRSTLRRRNALPLPRRPESAGSREDALVYLGITHSHPRWLVERWFDRVGFDLAERWVHFNNQPAPLTLRMNRLRASPETIRASLAVAGITTHAARYAPDGLVVDHGNPLQRPADGTVIVQDEASQLVSLLVGATAGDRVLDLCAAPGGKTSALAADMGNSGVLVASDVRPRRVALLSKTIAASGATNVRIVHVPAAGPLPFAPRFDRILVDAPCSGLGTLRRDPELKWRRHESDLARLASAQVELLQRAAEVLAKCGRLVYATCSSEPEENDMVVDRFLADRPDFVPVDLRADAPPALAPFIDDRGRFRTSPPFHGLEAFFGAALARA